jgi:hypothetical protein
MCEHSVENLSDKSSDCQVVYVSILKKEQSAACLIKYSKRIIHFEILWSYKGMKCWMA